ncbi:MAG: division/cell wall cluster transcriptional repressor MraZ [Caldiserica bacterium]|nr:MAG: division/cell wall cluster transcriptional repressor MraZ [Caldisericota bacterium]
MVENVGIFHLTLDSKNRFFLPKPFKRYKKFYITMGLENCLLIYSPKKWNDIILKLKKLSWNKESHRKFLRLFLSRARVLNVDSQSRVLLPQDLIEHAKIKKRIVLLNLLSRIEIWSEEEFKIYEKESRVVLPKVAEELDIEM